MRYQMHHNPYKVVALFEEEMARYTGAPFAVAVDSCTNALFLSCTWHKVETVTIPSRTYLSVPQSIIHAGGEVQLEELTWRGMYQLKPYPIYDSALRLTSNMYLPGTMICLSFHYKKHLPIGKGGMILTDDAEAADWLRKARYEGRSAMPYAQDPVPFPGWNMYMTPAEAATGLSLMQNLLIINDDLVEEPDYRDLNEFGFMQATTVPDTTIRML